MQTSARWFTWTIVVMVLHMAEQLATGLVELDRLKRGIAQFTQLFANADVAVVILVTIGAALIYLAMLGLLRGGRARFVTLEILGAFSLLEIHHVVETVISRAYTPGLITSVPYVVFGVLLMRAARDEFRDEPRVSREAVAIAAIHAGQEL